MRIPHPQWLVMLTGIIIISDFFRQTYCWYFIDVTFLLYLEDTVLQLTSLFSSSHNALPPLLQCAWALGIWFACYQPELGILKKWVILFYLYEYLAMLVIVGCRHYSWVAVLKDSLPSLAACIALSCTLNSSPERGGYGVRYTLDPLCPVLKMCFDFSYQDLI